MEIFCPISGFPNYIISNHGNVYSNRGLMKPRKNSGGYLQICLCNKIIKNHSISRLVALHFLEKTGNEVDHIDRNKLNNHVNNLRWVSRNENQRNRSKKQNCSSKYKGIYWNQNKNKWHVQCTINGKRKHLGYFDNEEDAGKAYDQFCREQGLTTTILNFP